MIQSIQIFKEFFLQDFVHSCIEKALCWVNLSLEGSDFKLESWLYFWGIKIYLVALSTALIVCTVFFFQIPTNL